MTSSLTAQILLAQAVYTQGGSSWESISTSMRNANILPVEVRQSWNTNDCEKIFKQLAGEHKLSLDETSEPESETARRLVEILYTERLRQIIQALKENAKRVDQHRRYAADVAAGKKDDELRAQATPQILKRLDMSSEKAEVVAESPATSPQDVTPKTRSKRGQQPSAPSTPAPANEDAEEEAAAVAESTPVRSTRRQASRAENHAAAEKDDDDANAEEGEEATAPEGDEGDDEEQVATRSRQRGRRGSAQVGTSIAATSPPPAASTKKNSKKRKASEPPAASSPPANRRRTTASRGTAKAENDDDADAAAENAEVEDEQTKREKAVRFKPQAKALLDRLTDLSAASDFKKPVDLKQNPLYGKAIKQPVSLADLKKGVGNGAITDWETLGHHILLMCANAVQYNGVASEIAENARTVVQTYEHEVMTVLSNEYGE